jgi:hypothetical protein
VPKSKGIVHVVFRITPDSSKCWRAGNRCVADKRSLLFPQVDEIDEFLDLVQALFRKGSDLLDQNICLGRHSGGSLSIATLLIQ